MKWFDDVKKYYAYRALIKRFVLPILVIFMVDQGLSIEQIAFITAVCWAAGAIMEVPSGAISDTLGHRRALVLGSLFQGLGMALYLGASFWWIFAGSFAYWVGGTLMTGTLSALFYERIKELGREKEYQKLSGRATAVSHGFGIVSMALASLAYVFMWWLPFVIGIVQFIAAAAVIGTFTPAAQKKSVSKEEGHASLWGHFPVAWKAFRKQKALFWLSVFNALIIGGMFAMIEFQQIVLENAGLAVALLGSYYAVKRLVAVVLAPNVHVFTKHFKAPQLMMLMGMITAAHLIVIALLSNPYAIALVFMVGAATGIIIKVAVSDYSNRLIEKGSRATTLSMKNFLMNVVMILFTFVIGWVSSVLSIESIYGWAGVLMAILLVIGFGPLARSYKSVRV